VAEWNNTVNKRELLTKRNGHIAGRGGLQRDVFTEFGTVECQIRIQ